VIYKIEHRINTIARNAIREEGTNPSFLVDEIKFSQWDFNPRDGWVGDYWLAEAEIEAPRLLDAINTLRTKLIRIIPRISFICQSYTEFLSEPFLVTRDNCKFAFLRYAANRKSSGLVFNNKNRKALSALLEETRIPEEFYYYWNDAINTIGASAKLLLMLSAIDSLARKDRGRDWDKIKNILGEELTAYFFGTKKLPNSGLRHRLVHGEYFKADDFKDKNYVECLHLKVIEYFNKSILLEDLIRVGVVRPQRHPFGNKEEGYFFLKPNEHCDSSMNLKSILKEVDLCGFNKLQSYCLVYKEGEIEEL
jgi:hypothetical protein